MFDILRKCYTVFINASPSNSSHVLHEIVVFRITLKTGSM